jgi:hypothetical protein
LRYIETFLEQTIVAASKELQMAAIRRIPPESRMANFKHEFLVFRHETYTQNETFPSQLVVKPYEPFEYTLGQNWTKNNKVPSKIKLIYVMLNQ